MHFTLLNEHNSKSNYNDSKQQKTKIFRNDQKIANIQMRTECQENKEGYKQESEEFLLSQSPEING